MLQQPYHNAVVWSDSAIGANVASMLWQCYGSLVVWTDFNVETNVDTVYNIVTTLIHCFGLVRFFNNCTNDGTVLWQCFQKVVVCSDFNVGAIL